MLAVRCAMGMQKDRDSATATVLSHSFGDRQWHVSELGVGPQS